MNIQQPDKADTSAATKAARKRFFDFIETLHKARSAACLSGSGSDTILELRCDGTGKLCISLLSTQWSQTPRRDHQNDPP